MNPCRSGGRIFFSRVNFLCRLLFRYPFHPRVTAVACKRPRSFCQRYRWQVTAKHSYTLCILVALHKMTWCMVVWYTQNVPRRQQFYVAQTTSALTPATTPRLGLCHNTLTPARIPRLGLCNNTDTSTNTKACLLYTSPSPRDTI